MNIDFDFDTLYKNERKSLKEIFDTLSQHIKTERYNKEFERKRKVLY